MIRAIALAAMVTGCAAAAPTEPTPPPIQPTPPVVETIIIIAPPDRIRAALLREVPREDAVVADADAGSIAVIRLLHRNVREMLVVLEREDRRHMTPDAIANAVSALKDLQAYLDRQ